jgi:hypothetical protein
MLNILLGVFFAAAVLNLTLFGGAVFWSLLAALLSLGLLGLRLLFASKVKPRVDSSGHPARSRSPGRRRILVRLRPAEGGFVAFESEVTGIERYLAQGEAFKAGEAWTESRNCTATTIRSAC